MQKIGSSRHSRSNPIVNDSRLRMGRSPPTALLYTQPPPPPPPQVAPPTIPDSHRLIVEQYRRIDELEGMLQQMLLRWRHSTTESVAAIGSLEVEVARNLEHITVLMRQLYEVNIVPRTPSDPRVHRRLSEIGALPPQHGGGGGGLAEGLAQGLAQAEAYSQARSYASPTSSTGAADTAADTAGADAADGGYPR